MVPEVAINGRADALVT
jgi:hypothetical protein